MHSKHTRRKFLRKVGAASIGAAVLTTAITASAEDYTIKELREPEFVTPEAQARIEALLETINKLPAESARRFVNNPPNRSENPDSKAIDELVLKCDPSRLRSDNAEVARDLLKMMAVLSGKRTDRELKAWETIDVKRQ